MDIKDFNPDNFVLDNSELETIYDLCSKVSEKYLSKDDEIYKWFHDKTNLLIKEDVKDENDI